MDAEHVEEIRSNEVLTCRVYPQVKTIKVVNEHMFGIIIAAIGVVGFGYGVLIIIGLLNTRDNDWHARLYAGSKGVLGGLALIVLGVVLALKWIGVS